MWELGNEKEIRNTFLVLSTSELTYLVDVENALQPLFGRLPGDDITRLWNSEWLQPVRYLISL